MKIVLIAASAALLLSGCGDAAPSSSFPLGASPAGPDAAGSASPSAAAVTASGSPCAPNGQDDYNATGTSTTTADGLQIVDVTAGSGAAAANGQKLSMHYTGWLTNCTKFDSSRDRGQPFSFTLGTGQVIKGWDEGIVGLKVGGVRKLVIPPSLGYGAQGQGTIPANSTLVFIVTLLSIG